MRVVKIKHLLAFILLFLASISWSQTSIDLEKKRALLESHFFESLKQKVTHNFDKAIFELEKCYQIDSVNVAVKFELAKNYFEIKNYNNALYFINKALFNQPKNVYFLAQKVSILKRQHKLNEAIFIQKKITEQNPIANNDLVLLYILNKDFNKAKSLLKKIDDNAWHNFNTQGLKKIVEQNKNKFKSKEIVNKSGEESISNLLKAYEQNKSYQTLLKIIKYYKLKQQYKQVNRFVSEGIEFYPTQPTLYLEQSLALIHLKKFNSAISSLTVGIDFVVDDNLLKIKFFKAFISCYQALNNENKVLFFKKKIAMLSKK
ncbi:MAG: tetratricopeptide repeat protein [Lutibacter sp.]